MSAEWESDDIIQRFRAYLKIATVHPDVDYTECVTFLKKHADDLDLPVRVYELVPKKPVVVITWKGSEPLLPAILLNSHMDVVPVEPEYWTHPPFDAHITEDGFIYARGTQDMKSVGMVHLEAVRRLKTAGVKLKRTVHISFVPDEEIGGADGMKKFSESEDFKALNIGFELDESIPSPNSDFLYAYNGERTSRHIKITCKGTPGHGSTLPNDTAGQKIHFMIEKLMMWRAQEKSKLKCIEMLGEVISINLTQMEGGVQVNVLPESLSASFDIRLPPHVDHDEFENKIKSWCAEAGDGVTFEYILKNDKSQTTAIDGSITFWPIICETLKNMGYHIKCLICPGGTDARFVRKQGIPAIGFSPFPNTPLLLHGHNERIHVNQFKKGIDIMEKVLQAVANYVPEGLP